MTFFLPGLLSLLVFLVHEENSRTAVTVTLPLLPRRGRQGEEEEGWWLGIRDFRMDLQGDGLKPPPHLPWSGGGGGGEAFISFAYFLLSPFHQSSFWV